MEPDLQGSTNSTLQIHKVNESKKGATDGSY